jgi:hypothetical protein
MAFQQPYLHDLTGVFTAPIQVWSDHHGQIRGEGAQGAYCGDDRVLARAVLTVNGHEPEWVSTQLNSTEHVDFIHFIRVPANVADPLVSIIRGRSVDTGRLAETLTFKSVLDDPVTLDVKMELVADALPMDQIKAGLALAAGSVAPEDRRWRWRGQDTSAELTAEGAELAFMGSQVVLSWRISLQPGDAVELGWSLAVSDKGAPMIAAGGQPLRTPSVAGDPRLMRLMTRSISDLNSLRIADRERPQHAFLAAGAPWHLTMFGRDALMAARMLLPIDATTAAGTLRALAGRQGTDVVPETGEEPGKILREVRRSTFIMGPAGTVIAVPPVQYGNIDATPLWIILLHDAWHSGMPEAEVKALLPHLEDALGWMQHYGDSDGDGFLEYAGAPGSELADQGWKDTSGSIRWHDGTPAAGPVALAEVQGYAHEAATVGAEMLDHFGRPGSGEWRAFASDLADRFREKFWCTDDAGPYPAIALDADKKPVDSIASNMGHLLGTGLLNAEEKAAVVTRLMDPSMFSGYGIRTLSTTNGGYWPTRYHAGSVWTHDSAWTLLGMLKDGFEDEAARLAGGMLDAAEGFDWRLPELFSGDPADRRWPPVPYPAACRPQAWAAASAVPIAQALRGFNVLG